MRIEAFKGGIKIDGKVISDPAELGRIILENVQVSEKQLTSIFKDYAKLNSLIELKTDSDVAHELVSQIMNSDEFPKCLPSVDAANHFMFYIPHLAVRLATIIQRYGLGNTIATKH